MIVRAKVYGQHNGRMYETGQTFDIGSADPAWWMESTEIKPPEGMTPVGKPEVVQAPEVVETQHEKDVREWLENEKK